MGCGVAGEQAELGRGGIDQWGHEPTGSFFGVGIRIMPDGFLQWFWARFHQPRPNKLSTLDGRPQRYFKLDMIKAPMPFLQLLVDGWRIPNPSAGTTTVDINPQNLRTLGLGGTRRGSTPRHAGRGSTGRMEHHQRAYLGSCGWRIEPAPLCPGAQSRRMSVQSSPVQGSTWWTARWIRWIGLLPTPVTRGWVDSSGYYVHIVNWSGVGWSVMRVLGPEKEEG